MNNIKTFFAFLCAAFYILITPASAQNITSNTNDDGFFPIAVWLQSPFRASEYKANGINLFVGVYNGLDQFKLNDFKKANMPFVCSQNEFARNHMDEPLIYAWMHGDEPDNAQWNSAEGKYDPCIDPGIIIGDYEEIKSIDSIRPVYLNLGRGVAYNEWIGRGDCTGDTNMYKVSGNGYLKGCDIASFDIYPVNSTEKKVQDSLWYVAKGIDNLEKWSEYAKPVWCWIETTRIDENSKRKPTTSEVKSEVWMAIIHGASGIGYFCHSFYPTFVEAALLQDQEMKNEVKKINAQITSVAAVLNSPDTVGIATVESSNPAVPVDILTKRYNNTNYIFAVAMRPGQTHATFTIKEGDEVQVLDEDRTIEVTDGKFTDDFSDYGVHIYKYSTTTTNLNGFKLKSNSNPKIYPNPTPGKLNVKFPAPFTGEITISDITGKIVLNKRISSQRCSFDLTGEKSGIYFVHVDSDENFRYRIIKL